MSETRQARLDSRMQDSEECLWRYDCGACWYTVFTKSDPCGGDCPSCQDGVLYPVDWDGSDLSPPE